jgi:hypothetical protein
MLWCNNKIDFSREIQYCMLKDGSRRDTGGVLDRPDVYGTAGGDTYTQCTALQCRYIARLSI